jgi:RNA-binding protein 48
VYTVASESKHLLIFGVPDLKLRMELKSALSKFGRVKKLVEVADYPNSEAFTKAYHILYEEIRNSR